MATLLTRLETPSTPTPSTLALPEGVLTWSADALVLEPTDGEDPITLEGERLTLQLSCSVDEVFNELRGQLRNVYTLHMVVRGGSLTNTVRLQAQVDDERLLEGLPKLVAPGHTAPLDVVCDYANALIFHGAQLRRAAAHDDHAKQGHARRLLTHPGAAPRSRPPEFFAHYIQPRIKQVIKATLVLGLGLACLLGVASVWATMAGALRVLGAIVGALILLSYVQAISGALRARQVFRHGDVVMGAMLGDVALAMARKVLDEEGYAKKMAGYNTGNIPGHERATRVLSYEYRVGERRLQGRIACPNALRDDRMPPRGMPIYVLYDSNRPRRSIPYFDRDGWSQVRQEWDAEPSQSGI